MREACRSELPCHVLRSAEKAMRDLALFVAFMFGYQAACYYTVEGVWVAFNKFMRKHREDWPE